MADKKQRKHFLVTVTILVCLLMFAAIPNIYYDPLCRFLLFSATSRPVPVIDARLQKTNHLLHGSADYSALLLGSSRVEQFRQQDFAPLKTFNYAAPSFYPDEASEYLDFFIKNNPVKLDTVFLGLDFYGSNSRSYEHAKSPRYYIGVSSNPFGALGATICRDTLKYSLRMARNQRDLFMYDQQTLDKLTQKQGPAEADQLLKRQLELYQQTFYGNYLYSNSYAAVLKKLKAEHPGLHFVIFTTPVSKDLFKLLVNSGRLPDYEHWIKDIVEVFGTVYNFMIIDKLTKDQHNFLDAHHLYPEKTAPLVRIISGRPLPEDSGIGSLITPQNLESHLLEVREMAQKITQEDIK